MAYTTINKSTDYFNTKLFTGTGSAQSITGVGFQPDWVWTKQRSGTEHHNSNDAVRGATKVIFPNLSNAEQTVSNLITGFVSDGFSVGDNAGANNNGSTYASWNWKAGTSVSGNTTGSGTYKTYTGSVNTTAGFSIIKYTGNGTVNHTIPHHLGVAPKIIITKNLDSGVTWIVGHNSIAWSNILFLDTNAAQSDDSNAFNDVAPTSTVWNIGSGNGTNSNNVNYISYCFAEKTGYSKFGSYTGNGNSDGTFIYTGFRPSWMMIKESSNAGNEWYISDGTRSPTNAGTGSAKVIAASGSGAEESGQSYNQFDIVSNGYKVRGDDTRSNGSGRTYIYMAFGQSIVGSNNVPCTAR